MNALSPSHGDGFSLRSASRSHVGRVRATNEDRVLERPETQLWAVADGMGGQRNGAEAATHVIARLASIAPHSSGYAFLADITRGLQAANEELRTREGGSTLVALVLHEDHYACLWAGDSRAYHLHGGHLTAVTRDHSMVQQMVDGGMLTEAERRAHPRAHIITRAIGVGEHLLLDRRFGRVAAGDRFLLCSDGLTGCFEEADLAAHLAGPDLSIAADALLETALARGAPDNVSFILLAAD